MGGTKGWGGGGELLFCKHVPQHMALNSSCFISAVKEGGTEQQPQNTVMFGSCAGLSPLPLHPFFYYLSSYAKFQTAIKSVSV